MAKYRKLPIVVEAFQYDGDLVDSECCYYIPEWAVNAHKDDILYYKETKNSPSELFIKTLEGDCHVSVGDFIIQGIDGELYPCNPDIFERIYETADTIGRGDSCLNKKQPCLNCIKSDVCNKKSEFTKVLDQIPGLNVCLDSNSGRFTHKEIRYFDYIDVEVHCKYALYKKDCLETQKSC